MNEKNTPRDFFLHTGAFITLYLSAIALITLLFAVINQAFPDPLSAQYYYDPYTGPIRFAIASLFVLTPLTVYLFYVIQKEARLIPERRTLGMRKWLTYITLFIAGITVVGDLIVLIDSFLGGTLPTPFLLKAALLLVVMGGGLWYFLLDIRGYWMEHAAGSRYVGIGVLGVVLGSVVGGMMLIGSPMMQRDLRIDNQQVSDLSSISQSALSYWQQTKKIPATLDEMENDLGWYQIPKSPEGQPAYEYVPVSDLSFKVCATFKRESTDDINANVMYQGQGFVEEGEQWKHKAGYTCFTRTIDPALFNPQPVDLPVSRIY